MNSTDFIKRMMNVTSWSAEPFIFIDGFRSETPTEKTCSPKNGNLRTFTRTGYRIGACIPILDVDDSSTNPVVHVDGWSKYACGTVTTCADDMCTQSCTTVTTKDDGICRNGTIRTCVDSDEAYQKSLRYLALDGTALDARSGLSTGAIVGIVLGGVGAVGLVVLAVVLARKRGQKQQVETLAKAISEVEQKNPLF
ncbi:hypothetical protein M427DRAFT_57573 [Gonapodya prolifera JEL478]|uniref:Uncharacterized protein n=1 Tax=Gonapodya prolifera (strain JEL478) TaxID=1344416 RepID=A0A139ACA3_GONPJ|nr:hypothetical protein M427DRAFT_57573 [Gonapodya prolifera JEL478]|eukprot:KXS14397.1 hypothetical protein M427DRAFT_57573 [Gonapodya prolifera JEL478]